MGVASVKKNGDFSASLNAEQEALDDYSIFEDNNNNTRKHALK